MMLGDDSFYYCGKEKTMAGKADIMGLPVDIVDLRELYGEIKQYLQNEY